MMPKWGWILVGISFIYKDVTIYICMKSSFRKLVLQEGQSLVRGYLHGLVYMKDTVFKKWSLLEGQPLIQGLFPWKCLYEEYCFRKVVLEGFNLWSRVYFHGNVCLYAGYCFRQVVFIREAAFELGFIYLELYVLVSSWISNVANCTGLITSGQCMKGTVSGKWS